LKEKISVDPCGENGEFHSFAFEGPIFNRPLKIEADEVVYKPIECPPAGCAARGFWYCDLQLLPLFAGA
jgi:diphthamide synthase (EF-2-diphthine--ammonia ligase)